MKVALLLSCAALFAVGHASAATLNVGDSIYNPSEGDPTGGSVIATLSSPFSVPGKYSGTLVSKVISGDPSNPFGGLTFTYSLTNNSGSPNPLTALTVNGFDGSLTDASYKNPGRAPTTIDRLTSDTVGFRFVPTINIPGFGPYGNGVLTQGLTSSLLVVQTNRFTYDETTAQVIDGAVTTVAALAPVPEPSTIALAGLGAIGAVLAARRRRG